MGNLSLHSKKFAELTDRQLLIRLVPSLEMLDKQEPPAIPDGYCMSVAYACLLDVIRSISLIVQAPGGVTTDIPASTAKSREGASNDEDAFSIQVVNSSWCGLLAALSLLLEARYADFGINLMSFLKRIAF